MERNRHIDFVIPSEARDLHFAANCRSLASLGMTKYRELGTSRVASATYTSFVFDNGTSRTRLPVAANTALYRAGAKGGTPGSPTPAGGASLFTICTSTCRGARFMRV